MTYPFPRKAKNYIKSRLESGNKKPIILRGARQVGKTAIVRQISQELGLNLVELNLDKAEDQQNYTGVETVADLASRIKLTTGADISQKGILLFIDEIQAQPQLIKLLRYIYESYPNLPVIAAGSLLEFYLDKHTDSFPVGRVEYAYMGPLDFLEFLNAIGKKELARVILEYQPTETMPLGLHKTLMSTYGQYLLVGGMPAAVDSYIRDGSMEEIISIQKDLLQGIYDDIPKYETANSRKIQIQHVLTYAPSYAGNVYKYQNFAGSNYKSREMQEAFATLERAGMIYQVQQTKSQALPITSSPSGARKLGFIDVGLVNASLDNHENLYEKTIVNSDFTGQIIEQSVLQQIRYSSTKTLPNVFRWVRDSNKSAAEVDFILRLNGQMSAIEVKAGTSGRLGSLFSFSDYTNGNARLVRLYGGLPRFNERLDYDNKSYSVTSLPLYLLPRLGNLNK
ncbi:MAG: ATP-binding protein [Candidatus Dojkabacteria bacterium]